MPILMLKPLSEWDLSKLITKNIDVLLEFVKDVLHNVLNVPENSIIVISVPLEESTHQSVIVQLVNTLTLTTFAKTVMSNVKLAHLMKSVLNVPTTLIEELLVNVNV